MKLLELAVLYGLIGVGCGLAAAVLRRGEPRRASDALLVAVLWPVYGPFLLASAKGMDAGEGPETDFLHALRLAEGTPLAPLLPDASTVRALTHRLREAASKVREIDALLRLPGYDVSEAAARAEQLQRAGSECALSAATMRVQNIRRLRGLRDRFARELEDLSELLAQLRTQADVVRLAGAPGADSRELVGQIIARVEGLDRMMDEEAWLALDRAGAPWNQTN